MDLRTDAPALLNGIYAIVNEGDGDPVALTRAILAGGVQIVQYRAKGGIVPAHARAMRELTRAREALFILNDDWRAVQTYDADGVHVGPEDAQMHELPQIRAAFGDRLIGVSCGTQAEARDAEAGGADYIGVGAVYATSSKSDAGPPIGIAGLVRVARATRLPVAAIGGITLDSIVEIRSTGVAMAAIISAIASSPDPHGATLALVREWNSAA
jgi:thiamine-phosphate pyrophosphorylase